MSESLDKKPLHVLLIDDEKGVLFALRLLLEAIGYRVTDFFDPQQALEWLTPELKADLIVCDLRMPGLNGLDVLRAAKAKRPDLPFVLMSAHAGTEETDEAERLGASDFLAKPFTPDQFHYMIEKLFGVADERKVSAA